MHDQQVIDAWVEFMRINQNRSRRTLEAYRLALERLGAFLEVKPLLQATPAELEPVVAAYRGRRPGGRFDGLPANPGAARP